MIFTTNKKPKTWGDVLHDDDLAEAIVDRILERGRLLRLDGPSIRTKHLADDDVVGDDPQTKIPPAKVSGKTPAEFPERTAQLVDRRADYERLVIGPDLDLGEIPESTFPAGDRTPILATCAVPLDQLGLRVHVDRSAAASCVAMAAHHRRWRGWHAGTRRHLDDESDVRRMSGARMQRAAREQPVPKIDDHHERVASDRRWLRPAPHRRGRNSA